MWTKKDMVMKPEMGKLSQIFGTPCERLLFRSGYGWSVYNEKSPQTLFAGEPCAWMLSLINKKDQTEEMVTTALKAELRSGKTWHSPILKFVSKKLLTPDICKMACYQHHRNLEYIPADVLTEEMRAIAKETEERIEREGQACFAGLPDVRPEESSSEDMPISTSVRPVALAIPSDGLSPVSKGDSTSVALAPPDFSDNSITPVYYISDIHLEHQLDLQGKTLFEMEALVQGKVDELMASVPERRGLILVGGDTAYSPNLAAIFFKKLRSAVSGMDVIAILGNHELWDGDPVSGSQRSIKEVMQKYVQSCGFDRYSPLLENALWMKYHGHGTPVFLNEKAILDATDDELSDLCQQSTQIVLGGIGFSGCNRMFNATKGIYRGTVSPEEDAARSARFRTVYEKVLRCAGAGQVIVLTHNPMHDWLDKLCYNPNWVYVSGHNHRNSLIRQDDGTTVLSDNQVGYEPRPLGFKCFTVKGRYDPFVDWQDGIHEITSEQYVIFNQARGISMRYRNTNPIRMVKRSGVYMFFREDNGKLYILSGGCIKKAEHGIEYYLSNLSTYKTAVTTAFAPFNAALRTVSKEIRAFGGSGHIHGCIVDIDFCNHVYLDPMSGKLTLYYALDIVQKWVFDDMRSLLEANVSRPYTIEWLHQKELEMLHQYEAAEKDDLLPILGGRTAKNNIALATVPELVLDTSMYDPSRIMRAVQYVFDQDVVRIWNDAVIDKYAGGAEGCLAVAPQSQLM